MTKMHPFLFLIPTSSGFFLLSGGVMKQNKVLLCPPNFFSVEYEINPWMKKGSVDKVKAQQQWQTLVNTYRKLNVEVNEVVPEKNLPDMVFTVDQGIVIDRKVVLSNFRFRERQPESVIYGKWFEDHGYEVVRPSKDHFLEGGECLWWRDQYLLGVGFRADKDTKKELAALLEKPVLYLELVNEFFYHLDTCFFPLNDEVAFYYPPAFSEQSQEFLKNLGGTLIEFTETEAKGFAANSIVFDKTVVTQKGNAHFTKVLKEKGYEVVELEMGEFMKSGGGIHCLSLQL